MHRPIYVGICTMINLNFLAPLGRKSYIRARIDIPLTYKLIMQEVELERSLETKFLGVIINHKLSWKTHILTVSNKVSENVGIIYKIRHLLPPGSSPHAVSHLLVKLYMSYCCILWADIDKTLCLDRIHKIQKHYCRLITFSDSRAHSAQLFKKLKILNTNNLFRFQASLYMHKHIDGLLQRTSLIFNVIIISILISPVKVKTCTKYFPENAVDNIHFKY